MMYDPQQEAWRAVQAVMQMNESAVKSYPLFIDSLRQVVERGFWREFLFEPLGKTKKFDTFEAFLKYVDVPPKELLAVLQSHDETALLAQVRSELGGELAENGTNQHSAGVRDTKPIERKDDATYVTARLRRDHPALAEQVLAGSLSANAAAVEAGIRKRYIRVPADDLDAAMLKVVDEFGVEAVRQAVEVLA